MSNRTDIVVETDNAEGQVLLSASRVYDLTEDKTQDTINGETKNTLNQLDQNMAYVESGNTASRTYTGGELISWKGTLYTASTAIPQNDPFTVGTNLAAVVDGNGYLCGGLNSLKNSLFRPKVYIKDQYYTTDATFGFASTGLNVAEDVIIGCFTPFENNIAIRFSQCYDPGVSGLIHRLQFIDATDGGVKLGVTYYAYLYYMKRTEIGA